MPKKRTLPTKYIPESMRTLLLFGCYDDRDVNESFDAFMISIHKDLICKEWQKFKEQLMSEWKHSCTPYAEALLRNELPQKEVLSELYQKEIKA